MTRRAARETRTEYLDLLGLRVPIVFEIDDEGVAVRAITYSELHPRSGRVPPRPFVSPAPPRPERKR